MGLEFGRRLKEQRKAKKLSLEQLGEKTGMTKGTISNYETGKRDPGGDAAARLARALDTTTDHLLTGEHDQEQQGARAEGERLFVEDVQTRAPHRLPDALAWLEQARLTQYIGTESWGRMVWYHRYLEDWDTFRKGDVERVPATPTESAFNRAKREKSGR